MSEGFAFNARGVEPAKPRDNALIPSGWHRAWITATEIRKTNKGDGRFLELTWEIVEGAAEKRRLWDRHNFDNPSEMTVKIAQEQISAICHATGVLEFGDPAELAGVVCMIKVGVERKANQPDRNKIYGYLPDGDPKATVAKPKVVAGATGAVRGGGRAPALEDDKDDGLPF
jgi:hypothetical protein